MRMTLFQVDTDSTNRNYVKNSPAAVHTQTSAEPKKEQ
jgi:hypothetical protein